MKKLFIFIALCFAAITSQAQIKYQDSYLLFNTNTRYRTYMTTWGGWAHCWINGSKMIKFDISSADARISSSTDKLVLYDTERSIFIDMYCRNVYTNSDEAVKTNIRTLTDARSIVMQLRPVTFEWADKTQYLRTSLRSTGASNPQEMGFVAQDIEKVLPDIVAIDSEGHRVVNYSAIIPLLTSTIQELSVQIEKLQAEVNALKSKK